jgi:hypothetical protein
MALWRDVRPRLQALQDAGVGIYEDHSRKELAFHLSGYLSGGDAVLLFNKDVYPADNLPVIVPLGTLEKLIAAAKVGEKETV